ncbi:uroporphyrinogen-III C-methyltransferase [Thiohalomonas denitrificans]|uniref:Uroporphyrin-3 C-methyltransferase n=1 Tax=Thiohalomonas denitrificans TaxID=415747 RepID=A0A1G5QXZ7_9GAMM|nr:uroporphyrinogen-III C-methyltransferase [Thiohalomonas denitrificans]SCZ66744.1 uroporphyrin-3 C-methyltransferase [Thiohalomonas denitrificans]
MSEKSGLDKTEQKTPTKRNDRKRPGTPKETQTPAKSAPKAGRRGTRQEANPSPDEPKTPRGGGGTLLLALLALLAAAAAGAGGWYVWQQQQSTTARIAATESELQASITELQVSVDRRISRQSEEISQASNEGDRRLEARTRELQQAIIEIRSRLGQDRTGWALSEVEHLLRIANHRVRLARDVQGAEVALREADQRLVAVGDPAFLPVREAISKELQALRNTGGVDREHAALRLTGLIDTVDALPVAGAYKAQQGDAPGQAEAPRAPENVSNWKEFLGAVWEDIRSLVSIRRHGEETNGPTPLLAPEERYFLHQNLRLKLETARLALLEGNPQIYTSSLAEVEQWLNRYFLEEAAATRGALETVKEMQGVKVRPELPDISESLRMLQRVRRQLGEEDRQTASEQEPTTGESLSGEQPEATP